MEQTERSCVSLDAFIKHLAQAAEDYTALAIKADGRLGQALAQLAADCRRWLRQLQTVYFLREGDSCPAECMPLPEEGLPGQLRQMYFREATLSGDLLRAGAQADEPGMRTMYADLAAAAERRQRRLWTLVAGMLE